MVLGATMKTIKTFLLWALAALISLLTLSFLKTTKDKGEVKKELREAVRASDEHDKEFEALEEAKKDPEGVQATDEGSEEYWKRTLGE